MHTCFSFLSPDILFVPWHVVSFFSSSFSIRLRFFSPLPATETSPSRSAHWAALALSSAHLIHSSVPPFLASWVSPLISNSCLNPVTSFLWAFHKTPEKPEAATKSSRTPCRDLITSEALFSIPQKWVTWALHVWGKLLLACGGTCSVNLKSTIPTWEHRYFLSLIFLLWI